MLIQEFSAKTVKSAIEEGLRVLDKTIDEVNVKILSQGGFLRKAKVQITVLGREGASEKTDAQESRMEKPAAEKPRPEKKQEPYVKKQEASVPQKQEAAPQQKKQDFSAKKQEQFGDKRRDAGKDAEAYRANWSAAVGGARPERNERPKRDFPKRSPEGHKDEEQPERKERKYTAVTQETAVKAETFLRETLKFMQIPFEMEATNNEGHLLLNINSESGALIGYRGETLDALEYLVSLSVNREDEAYYRISVDCNGYRAKREQTLASLARRMASKAMKTGRKVTLEPMSSSSRKIIHSILSSNDKIFTKSEGREPNRYVVIIPKRRQFGYKRPTEAEEAN